MIADGDHGHHGDQRGEARAAPAHARDPHGRHQGRRLQHDRREAARRPRAAGSSAGRSTRSPAAAPRRSRASFARIRTAFAACDAAPASTRPDRPPRASVIRPDRPGGPKRPVSRPTRVRRTPATRRAQHRPAMPAHSPSAVGLKPPADWRRRSVRRLRTAGGPRAPERVRAWLQATTEWLPDELESNLLLLTCELVNNSVLHGEAGEHDVIEIELRATENRLRAQVTDPGTGLRARRPHARARRAGRLGPGPGGAARGELGRGARRAHARLVRAGRSGLDARRGSRLPKRTRVRAGSGTSSKWSASAAMIGMPRPPMSSSAAGPAGRRSCRSRTPRSRSTSSSISTISSTPWSGSPQAEPCRTALATASLVASMRSHVVSPSSPCSAAASRTIARASGALSGAAGSHDSRFMTRILCPGSTVPTHR